MSENEMISECREREDAGEKEREREEERGE
jgi:hypothetical protein